MCARLGWAAVGDLALEKNGLAFRLLSDINIISYQKQPQALCQFLRWLAIEKGMGEVKLEDHRVAGRFHTASWMKHERLVFGRMPTVEHSILVGFDRPWYLGSEAADGQDPLPVTFRYTVDPKENFITHVFRPKADGVGREGASTTSSIKPSEQFSTKTMTK